MSSKICLWTLLLCAPFSLKSQVAGKYYNLHNPDAALPASITNVIFLHVIIDSAYDIGDSAGTMENIGRIEPFPSPRSEKFEKIILKSEKQYAEKKYFKAAKTMRKAYRKESNNPFIMYGYARALYWGNESKYDSYVVYKDLVAQLDNGSGNNDSTISMDFWFREAYWKLGTLHMDYRHWEEALFEISRFILSIQDAKGTEIYDQAMAFLTECAYRLGNRELCEHFGNRALMYNPNNEYVKKVLMELDSN